MIDRLRMNKKMWVLIALAEAVFLLLAVFFYSRREPVQMYFSQEDLIDETGEACFYVDSGMMEKKISTREFVLPRGMYTVNIAYEYSGRAKMNISYTDGRYVSNVSGNIPVTPSGRAVCDFKVSYENRPMQVNGMMMGDAGQGDYLLIREITITDSPLAVRNLLLQLGSFLLLLDLLLFWLIFRKKVTQENITYARLLFLLTAFGSIPLFTDYLLGASHDLAFHLMRIEGVREGLQSGMFPVRIQPNWLHGHGYAASVFYGDIFLYLPAALRMFGISIQAAYKLYVLFVNISTVFIAFYCFAKMSSKRVGFLCAGVYSLNIYRLTCVYTRAAVGEYTAMIFLPVVLYGFWKVYRKPEESEAHKKSWFTIVLGYTGILMSHMITCELTAAATVVICLIMWRKTFSTKSFFTLTKAAIVLVTLNLWFLVPIMDYLSSGTYVLNEPEAFAAFRLDERAIIPAQLFMNTYDVSAMSTGMEAGIINEMPQTTGTALLLILALWFVFCMGKKTEDGESKREERICVALCVICLFMTTTLFPYAWLAELFPILQFPERSIQYPWRFLSLAGVGLTWLACMLFRRNGAESRKGRILACVIVGISCWQALTFMSLVLQNNSPMRVYQMGNMSTFEVAGGEYLPPDYNVDDYVNEIIYDSEKVAISGWERAGNTITVHVDQTLQDGQQVEVPFVNYKGYEAETETGAELDIVPGRSGRVSVVLPVGFSGSFHVEFREPWYWRICELISLFTLLGIAGLNVRKAGTFVFRGYRLKKAKLGKRRLWFIRMVERESKSE